MAHNRQRRNSKTLMGITRQRFILALVVLGLTAFNPLHLPWSLPWLTQQMGGTSFGEFLRGHEGAIIVIGTVYFIGAMIPVYYWIWQRTTRRRAEAKAPTRVPERVPATNKPDDDGYRGPGGGKRAPRPSRSRRRRSRPRS
jgi:hypothetical protein